MEQRLSQHMRVGIIAGEAPLGFESGVERQGALGSSEPWWEGWSRHCLCV
jgi:hypothetical protein